MLCKAYSSLLVRTRPHRVGREVRRLFSKFSERESKDVYLLKRKNIQNTIVFDKWNKLGGKGRLLSMVNHRHFSDNCSDNAAAKQFLDTFPMIVKDLVEDPTYSDIPEAMSASKVLLEYALPTGNKYGGMFLLHCYKCLEGPANITPEKMKLANILGWCIEMLNNSILIADDIVDDSEMRGGKKSWHRNEDVGLRAVIGVTILENYAYQLLKKHFSRLPMYAPAMELLQEAYLKVAFGQLLDLTPLDANKGLNLSKYTRERYQTIVKYKNIIIMFELPYGLARCLSNKFHTEIPSQTREIFKKLGEFLQVQNDFYDCYNDQLAINKTANDITEGRCTWLIVVALERANPEQRRLLEAHYGKKDRESEKIVKELYRTLGIPKAYATFEEEAFDFIEKNYEEVSKLACLDMMFKRLDKLYQPYI